MARLVPFALGVALCLGGSASAADAPSWLSQAAGQPLPAYDKAVPAVVLLDEAQVEVQPDGRTLRSSRFAVRVLSRAGRRHAVADEPYVVDSARFSALHAWLLRPDGTVKAYDGDDVLDVAIAANDVYNEVRRKTIQAGADADVGAVFGYEVVREDREVFPQIDWSFQGELPALLSRLRLSVPAGWKADAILFNHAPLPQAPGAPGYVWELRDLPYIRPEPARPGLGRLAPRLAVTLVPGPGAKALRFGSWADVAGWLSSLHDPQAQAGPAIAAKARELTAAARDDLERIRAIARFCQKLSYVSVQTGVGRGGGYRPHAADFVLGKGYGDCKDKANLMRALLAALRIEAYPLAVYSSDRDHVREEWPSPQQFDHCILAVKVAEGTALPSVTQHPTLGPLLVFDPTSTSTSFGDLPADEQGSLGLLVHPRSGGVLRLPRIPPEATVKERTVEAALQPDGRVTGAIRELSRGQEAADERQAWAQRSPREYRDLVEAWVAQGAPGAVVQALEPIDDPDAATFRLAVEFAAPRYAQLMQGRLMIFKPALVSRRQSQFLAETDRLYPVVLSASSFTETARFSLPADFAVDELPDVVSADEAFGSYTARCRVSEGRLVYERRLLVRPVTVPVTEYDKVRRFFELVRSAEQAPVVLARTAAPGPRPQDARP
jgi:hypothetical protein